MSNTIPQFQVLSTPATCLHCHHIVEMVLVPSKDHEESDRWECPRCLHLFPSKWWKLRKQRVPTRVA
jgi:hypothetical protein